LPIIRISPDKIGHSETKSGEEIIEECAVPTLFLTNVGAQNAFPKEILYGWAIGDKLPNEPSYQYLDPFELNSILKPSQSAFVKRLTCAYVLTPGQWAEISGGNRLWFYCCLLYDDFVGDGRSHGFCWRWCNTGMGMGWRAEAQPAYNRKS